MPHPLLVAAVNGTDAADSVETLSIENSRKHIIRSIPFGDYWDYGAAME